MDLRNNDITLEEVMQNEKAMTLINAELGAFVNSPLFAFGKKLTLKKIIEYAKGRVEDAKVNDMLEKLKKI